MLAPYAFAPAAAAMLTFIILRCFSSMPTSFQHFIEAGRLIFHIADYTHTVSRRFGFRLSCARRRRLAAAPLAAAAAAFSFGFDVIAAIEMPLLFAAISPQPAELAIFFFDVFHAAIIFIFTSVTPAFRHIDAIVFSRMPCCLFRFSIRFSSLSSADGWIAERHVAELSLFSLPVSPSQPPLFRRLH